MAGGFNLSIHWNKLLHHHHHHLDIEIGVEKKSFFFIIVFKIYVDRYIKTYKIKKSNQMSWWVHWTISKTLFFSHKKFRAQAAKNKRRIGFETGILLRTNGIYDDGSMISIWPSSIAFWSTFRMSIFDLRFKWLLDSMSEEWFTKNKSVSCIK